MCRGVSIIDIGSLELNSCRGGGAQLIVPEVYQATDTHTENKGARDLRTFKRGISVCFFEYVNSKRFATYSFELELTIQQQMTKKDSFKKRPTKGQVS